MEKGVLVVERVGYTQAVPADFMGKCIRLHCVTSLGERERVICWKGWLQGRGAFHTCWWAWVLLGEDQRHGG